MASLAALLAAYPNLGAGDTIYVDTGTYTLTDNIVIPASNSGVTIVGPVKSGHAAVLNRGNAYTGSDGILVLGSNVTLKELGITGANVGIDATGATNLTVSGSVIDGNSNYGIEADSNSTGLNVSSSSIYNNSSSYYGYAGLYLQGNNTTVANNIIYDNGGTYGDGINMSGTGDVISGNTVHNNGYGISLSSYSGTVSGNTVYGDSQDGIDVSNSASQATVSGNTVYGEPGTGISVTQSTTVVSGNTVYGSGTGINIETGTASGNILYSNTTGLNVDGGTASGNRVFNNSGAGIVAYASSSVSGNDVYSNATGILAESYYYYFNGSIVNNLVYANSGLGIDLRDASGTQVLDNTVYQIVGDALRVESSNGYGSGTGSSNVGVFNNIFWTQSGYDINVDNQSQVGFSSDYNDLFKGTSSNANIGYWNGTDSTFANWQSASSQDTHSINANPDFVDIAGADNVLGYSSQNAGYDGGRDDNFYLSEHSPAIDMGDSWKAARGDLLGQPRQDDPGTPNTGTPDYFETTLAKSDFAATGVAQGWTGSNTYWNLSLPFNFPFYGNTYGTAYVSTNGFVDFRSSDYNYDPNNSDASLANTLRIAPLWESLNTNGTGDDIFVDTSKSNQITIRWAATQNSTAGGQVNFSVTLFSSGTIQFDYGSVNKSLSPTIGISEGAGLAYVASKYDKAATLASVDSVTYSLAPGIVDIGCYEFRGNSNDTTPPVVTGTTPTAIGSGGMISPISQIGISFSQALNEIDANAPAEYQLIGAISTAQFDTANETVYTVVPKYVSGSKQVTLTITGAQTTSGAPVTWSGTLPKGMYYRLTIQSNVHGASIHDLSGLSLDGTNSGTPGTDYVTIFNT
jgi:parallel beta-helix repeat protein